MTVIAATVVVLTIADYAFTAYDMHQSYKILEDVCASDTDKLLAGLNIGMAVIFELIEPDELLPIAVPADDVARKIVMKEAREALNEGGIEGFEASVRHSLGDETADRVFKEIGLDDFVRKCGINSFSADTLVLTDQGPRLISGLQLGDLVWALNEETGEFDFYPVIDTIAHQDTIIVYLTIDGELIKTTPEHPFYTLDRDWVVAGQLQVGERVLKADGSYGVVDAVVFVVEPQRMYNLTVDQAHTFVVGDGGWLVHNVDCFTTPGGRTLTKHARDQAQSRGISLQQIDRVIDSYSRRYDQLDGATAYLRKERRNRYDVVIVGDEGIVTVIGKLKRHELRQLARNYSWQNFDLF